MRRSLWRWPALAAAVVVSSGALARGGAAQSPVDDPLVAALLGTWEGEGVYEGSRLRLTRAWTLELDGQFLRGDMRVTMANGFSFGALTYWRPGGDGTHDVVWMDGTGRMQSLVATADPASGGSESLYLDEDEDGGVEWRRWTFEPQDPDHYVERLFTAGASGWEPLTEFRFRRTGGR